MTVSIQPLGNDAQTKFSWLRAAAAGAMLLVGVGILAFAMDTSSAANKDFVTYWAAAKQLTHHANPYDGTAILQWERAAGCKETKPYFMRNPPTAFFVALPFGLMSERKAALDWSLLLVLSTMASIRMLWKIEGRPLGSLHLVGYMFPPVLTCLTLGQVGILLLLGFTTFLYWHEAKPFFAGLSLMLCALKPHLAIPATAILLLWCIGRRKYAVLGGLATGLAACLVLAWIVDPVAWPQYMQMMRTERLMDEPLPTLSLLFRAGVDVHAVWLQFVPAAVATVWMILVYVRTPAWSWGKEGLLLITVSAMAAPYAFVTDEAIVLPAVLHGLLTLARTKRSLAPFLCVLLPGLAEALAGVPVTSFWYVWTTPAWLAFYLYATRAAEQSSAPDPAIA
jgi:hypothetical protein